MTYNGIDEETHLTHLAYSLPYTVKPTFYASNVKYGF